MSSKKILRGLSEILGSEDEAINFCEAILGEEMNKQIYKDAFVIKKKKKPAKPGFKKFLMQQKKKKGDDEQKPNDDVLIL